MNRYDEWKLATPPVKDYTNGGDYDKEKECLICGMPAGICGYDPLYCCDRCGFEFTKGTDVVDVIGWAEKEQSNMFILVEAYNNRREYMDCDLVECVEDEVFIDMVKKDFGLLIKKRGV